MGSRIMHAIIAVEVAKIIKPQDINMFVLGAIAPDASGNKETSHFFTGSRRAFTREVNYKKFWECHGDTTSDYLKGYYCHLVADEKWLNGFYSTWLKKLTEIKPEIQVEYTHDFMKLNQLLLKEYTDSLDVIVNLHVTKDFKIIEGINKKQLESLVEALLLDAHTFTVGDLKVFTYDSISSYIKACVDRIAYHIQHLQ